MGLLNKAKSSATTKVSKPKGSVWMVDGNVQKEVDDAIAEYLKIQAVVDENTAKLEPLKDTLKKYAETQFINSYLAARTMPDSPMSLQNSDGKKVTYVVQDRSGQNQVDDAKLELLKSLLGEDAAEKIVWQQHTFVLNPNVLSLPGVSEIVEKHLEAAVAELVDSEIVLEETAGQLIEAESKRTLKPGVLGQLCDVVGADFSRIKQFLHIVGGVCTRYIKG